MENNVKAKIIVDVIRRSAVSATTDYIRAEADLAGLRTGSDLWEKDSMNDFCRNPYNVETAIKTVTHKREEKLAREKVLAYATDVFLEKIPNE